MKYFFICLAASMVGFGVGFMVSSFFGMSKIEDEKERKAQADTLTKKEGEPH
jgi:hypothetical protein